MISRAVFSAVGGLEEEKDYPYTAVDGLCEFNPSLEKAYVHDSFNITEGDEDQLALAIAYFNPVSIAFEVVSDFRFYKEGVYNSGTKFFHKKGDFKKWQKIKLMVLLVPLFSFSVALVFLKDN
jgi:hypothetical protein